MIAHGQKKNMALRFFSDRLLGYSPMAPSIPTAVPQSTNEGDAPKPKIPTAQDLTTMGGVWAPTSAKRDKLVELKAALEKGQQTLDDAASPEEKLDLYLADGLQLIAKATDGTIVSDMAAATTDIFGRFEECLKANSANLPEMLDETTWNTYLTTMSTEINRLLSLLPHARYLRHVRDFYDVSQLNEDERTLIVPQIHNDTSEDAIQDAFVHAITRFRLQLADAAAQHLKKSWKVLTTVSDGDIDRAAVVGSTLEKQATLLPLARVNDILTSYALGTCTDRVESWWKLMDRDGDGLLDQFEMDQIASLSMAPVQAAITNLFLEALESYPVRAPPLPLGTDNQTVPQPKGWRQRRKEANIKQRLTRLFKRAVQNHFPDEVELPHRLRCIYAWANKAHQTNKIDSVLVESSFGRKRYVELSPKISFPEFREVQREHFSHLDRVGTEIVKSFREDLWVAQGKGRQNRELILSCTGYLVLVSVIDYVIISL